MITIPLKPLAIAYLAAITPVGSIVTLSTILAMFGCGVIGSSVYPPMLLVGLGIGAAYTALFMITFTAFSIVLSPV